jgi:UDP-2,3-diacylglucosamine hydrolase
MSSSIEVAFISDLHLHPDMPHITIRFNQFIDWAAKELKTLYILGDFFHAWPGDDGFDPWSEAIAHRLKSLSLQGVTTYFMHGNRDFLIGKRFIEKAGLHLLKEPALIALDDTSILLAHGDRYCTKDTRHQIFRKLTRNPIFKTLFLATPLAFRQKMVASVRRLSQSTPYNPINMNVVNEVLLAHMQRHSVTSLIHGHTHKPGLTEHSKDGVKFFQFVLSDWDDNPLVLCYNKSKGLHFTHVF